MLICIFTCHTSLAFFAFHRYTWLAKGSAHTNSYSFTRRFHHFKPFLQHPKKNLSKMLRSKMFTTQIDLPEAWHLFLPPHSQGNFWWIIFFGTWLHPASLMYTKNVIVSNMYLSNITSFSEFMFLFGGVNTLKTPGLTIKRGVSPLTQKWELWKTIHGVFSSSSPRLLVAGPFLLREFIRWAFAKHHPLRIHGTRMYIYTYMNGWFLW